MDRATFTYKGHVVGIPVAELQDEDGSSHAIELLRKKMRIGKDKLVFIQDEQGKVCDGVPTGGQRYAVKVEPEEMSGFRLWETFQCCSMEPVGWDRDDD